MKKMTLALMSLMLFLGMGTAFADNTVPNPVVTPADGASVEPNQSIIFSVPAGYEKAAFTILVWTFDENVSLDDLQFPDDMGGLQDGDFPGVTLSMKMSASVGDEGTNVANWMPDVTVPADASGAVTLKARMVIGGSSFETSATVTMHYTVGEAVPVQAPTFDPVDGSKIMLNSAVKVVYDGPDHEGATQYSVLYVLNNPDFNFAQYTDYDDVDNSMVYTSPIVMAQDATVTAITVKYKFDPVEETNIIIGWSEKVSASYTVVVPPAAPTFNPNGGEILDGTPILLTNGTEGATPKPIYYNFKTAKALTDIKTKTDLDNANRQMATLSNAKLYSSAGIQIKKDQTVNAATADIDENGNVIWSAVVTKAFTYVKPAVVKPAAPVFNPDGGKVAANQKITLTQSAGEEIYYCLNGEESDFLSWETSEDLGMAEYYGSLKMYDASEGIVLTEDATVWAAAVLYNNDDDETITWSDIISREFTVEGGSEPVETVAVPVITPGNDVAVHMGDKVTITCATAGAEIYYTTDGTAPFNTDKDGYPESVKDGALKYTEPFELTEDMLVKQGAVWALKIRAVAVKGDAISSNGGSAGYNVYPNNPAFSVESGILEKSTEVSITCVPSQAVIYYTVDGTTPTMEEGTEYKEPIAVTKSATVKAIAVLGQYQSSVVTATYAFLNEVELAFDPESGSEVEFNTEVSITASANVDIFYMMFESEAAAKAAEWDNEQALLYDNELKPVVTMEKNTIKAACALPGAESVGETYFYATYTVKELPDIELTFNPASGSEVEAGTEITVTANRQTDIFYNLYADEAAADADEAFVLNAKEVVEDGMPVITEGNIYLRCAVSDKGEMTYFNATYTLKEKQVDPVEAPVFNPAAGAVKKGTKVSIACATEGAVIYYTVDGTEPTAESTEYKDEIEITANVTVKAIAIKGEAKSEVVEAAYTIDFTANEDEELAGVTVYPNPSNGLFNIDLPVAATIEVFASNGVLTQRVNAAAGVFTLTLDRSGIYFLRIAGEGRATIKRVIVR